MIRNARILQEKFLLSGVAVLVKDPWKPHGLALLDYFHGDTDAEVIVHSAAGEHIVFPVSIFFRKPQQFSPLENTALELCRGRVLDIGAGTGCHSLYLQDHGLSVCAVDILPDAVEVEVFAPGGATVFPVPMLMPLPVNLAPDCLRLSEEAAGKTERCPTRPLITQGTAARPK